MANLRVFCLNGEMNMEIKDKNKIWYWFFERIRSIDEIVKIMDNKYKYSEIKSVIFEKFK